MNQPAGKRFAFLFDMDAALVDEREYFDPHAPLVRVETRRTVRT